MVEESGESDEEPTGELSLEELSKETHPCLVKGDFSIFNSSSVEIASSTDIGYTLDMDGIVVLSR